MCNRKSSIKTGSLSSQRLKSSSKSSRMRRMTMKKRKKRRRKTKMVNIKLS
jgi:hypothetical protein